MFNKIKFSLALPLMTVLVACSSGQDLTQPFPLPKVESQFQLKPVWKQSVGKGTANVFSELAPLLIDHTLYVVARNGEIKALDFQTGEEIWKTKLSQHVKEEVALNAGVVSDGNKLYLSDNHNRLFALNRQDGTLVWSATTEGGLVSAVSVEKDRVFVQTETGYIQAFNAQTGNVIWTAFTQVNGLTVRGNATPLPYNQQLLVGIDGGKLLSLNQTTGLTNWSMPIANEDEMHLVDIDVAPLIVDNVAYVASYAKPIVAIDIQTGKKRWEAKYNSALPFLKQGNQLIVIDKNSVIHALNASTGEQLWQQDLLSNRNLTAAVMYQGSIVVGDYEGYLHFMDPTTGQFIAQQRVDNSGLYYTLQVFNNQLVMQSKNGGIYVFSR